MRSNNQKKLALVIYMLDKAQRDNFWLKYDKVYYTLVLSILGIYFLLPYID
jgi:hypothetical protein